jgi:hypothetical protein
MAKKTPSSCAADCEAFLVGILLGGLFVRVLSFLQESLLFGVPNTMRHK